MYVVTTRWTFRHMKQETSHAVTDRASLAYSVASEGDF
jgi:putative flippase GtrA